MTAVLTREEELLESQLSSLTCIPGIGENPQIPRLLGSGMFDFVDDGPTSPSLPSESGESGERSGSAASPVPSSRPPSPEPSEGVAQEADPDTAETAVEQAADTNIDNKTPRSAALEAVTVDSPAADTVLVRGGLVVSGAGAEQTDILVEGGLVVAVGPGLQQPVHPHTLVEAAGLLVTAGVAGAVPGLPGAAVVLEQIPADRSVAEHLAVRQPTAEDFCLVAGLVEGQDPAQLVAAGVSVLQLEPGLTPAQLMSALLAAGRAGAVARMELRPGLAGQEVELRRAATMARQAAASLLLTGVTDPAATALLARLCEAGWAVAGEPRAGPGPRDRADPARWVREQLEPAARLLGRQTELVADGPADLVVWGEAGAQWVLRGGRVHVAAGVPETSPTTGSLIRLPVRPRATNVQTRRVDRAPPAPAPAPAPREEVQPVSLEPTSPFQRKLSVHGVRNQQDSTFSLTELHTPAPVTQQHRRASVKVNAPPGGLSKSFW